MSVYSVDVAAADFEQLLEIVRRDRNFKDGAARKTMLQLFSVLDSDPWLANIGASSPARSTDF